MLWTEFWAGQPKGEYEKPLFKTQKTNMPRKHPTPAALKDMLAATKSEILDPKNRNKCRTNLPPGEMKALAKLIEMQKQQMITIKPCDKGAGIIILDFKEYIRACESHLDAKQPQSDGSYKPYYTKVDKNALEDIRATVNQIVEEAYDNDIIKKEAMMADTKTADRFHATFKVHKNHETGKLPEKDPL